MRIVLSVLIVFVSFVFELFAQSGQGKLSITSPIDPPFYFSGDFGELRPSHFHSGLDFRTQGKSGLPVYSVMDGYISRISISPGGYGNALYMNHTNGTTSVYGHLQRFHPKLGKYIREKQYDRESFPINLNISSDEFHFNQGDTIAWSGNSGASGGPHLHFEIRDTKSERALNPLLYPFGVSDNSAPKITGLYMYPLSENSHIGKVRSKCRFEVAAVPGGFRLKNNAPIDVYGKIGFGIQAEDYFNGTGLKCGIYSAALYCDKRQIFGFKMDNFSLSDTRYANAQADYEEHLRSNRWVERLFRLPGNYLDIYYPAQSDGILNLNDGKGHEFEIVVSDAFKNKAVLKFKTISINSQLQLKNKPFTMEFFFDKVNVFENEKIKIEIPKGALYDNLKFDYHSAPKPKGCYSEQHQVHSKFIPIQIPYSLSLKCDEIPNRLKSKALIISIDPVKGNKTAIGGEYSGGWVTVKTNILGNFAVAVDQTSPVIKPLNPKGKKTFQDNLKVQFHITDDLSGIKNYRGEIDGKWILFEYDQKTGTLSYTFDKERMAFGKSHLLRLVVSDFRENTSEYKAIIYK